MPRVVKEFPAKHRRDKYAKYLDGQVWLFDESDAKAFGVESVATIRNGINAQAHRQNIKVCCSLTGGKLYVQATTENNRK